MGEAMKSRGGLIVALLALELIDIIFYRPGYGWHIGDCVFAFLGGLIIAAASFPKPEDKQ